jgi:hypothetical protein
MAKKKSRPNHTKTILVIAFIVVVVAAYFFYSTRDVLAAEIDGQKIYAQRVDVIYDTLPKEAKLTKQQILQQLIDTKVLVDYIKKQGYDFTEEEFQNLLNLRLAEGGITMDRLNQELALRGATLEDVKDTMLIEYFVETILVKDIAVTDIDIANYRVAANSTASSREIADILFAEYRRTAVAQIIKTHRQTIDINVYVNY